MTDLSDKGCCQTRLPGSDRSSADTVEFWRAEAHRVTVHSGPFEKGSFAPFGLLVERFSLSLSLALTLQSVSVKTEGCPE